MSSDIDKIKVLLNKNPIQYVDGNSLLEQLYWCYTECNLIENSQLREQYKKIYQMIPELSEERFDEIFAEISKLLMIDETLAFQAGVKTGLRLTMELLE